MRAVAESVTVEGEDPRRKAKGGEGMRLGGMTVSIRDGDVWRGGNGGCPGQGFVQGTNEGIDDSSTRVSARERRKMGCPRQKGRDQVGTELTPLELSMTVQVGA